MQFKYRPAIIAICIAIFTCISNSNASESSGIKHFFTTNIDYELSTHFSLGGAVPLGFPREIRKIESYNPALQLGIGFHATKWFSERKDWGIRLQVGVEGKGMKTRARVKNYLTEVIQEQSYVRGYFTGLVETDIKNTYFVVPLSVVYGLSDHVNLYGGLRASFLIDRGFSGHVSDGYLRQGTPVGAKISFEGDSRAAYDFSDAVNPVQWGTQIGIEWALRKNLNLFTHFEYNFNGLLKNDFTAISFDMHNMYMNIGFGYQF